ncbi:MAG: shikimate kinase [Chitinophagaceae bacterium]
MVVFLVGFMGSGKNWWGSTLAEKLGIPFFDLDAEVEKSTGMDIVSIFREKGEFFFREKEMEVLSQLYDNLTGTINPMNDPGNALLAIIATGGGTPCYGTNMEWLNKHGLTVWLNPAITELTGRLEKETEKRPLLHGKTGRSLTDFIEMKVSERKRFYNLARIEIKNTHIAVEEFINLLHNASHIH